MKSFILRDNAIRDRAIEYIASLPLEPLLEVDVYKHKKKRTTQQNKLYWAILNELAEVSPHSSEVWAEYFKQEFIGIEEKIVNGRVIKRGISTTTLSTTEFADYVTRIQVFYNDLRR
jgi:hypothetical protein